MNEEVRNVRKKRNFIHIVNEVRKFNRVFENKIAIKIDSKYISCCDETMSVVYFHTYPENLDDFLNRIQRLRLIAEYYETGNKRIIKDNPMILKLKTFKIYEKY